VWVQEQSRSATIRQRLGASSHYRWVQPMRIWLTVAASCRRSPRYGFLRSFPQKMVSLRRGESVQMRETRRCPGLLCNAVPGTYPACGPGSNKRHSQVAATAAENLHTYQAPTQSRRVMSSSYTRNTAQRMCSRPAYITDSFVYETYEPKFVDR